MFIPPSVSADISFAEVAGERAQQTFLRRERREPAVAQRSRHELLRQALAPVLSPALHTSAPAAEAKDVQGATSPHESQSHALPSLLALECQLVFHLRYSYVKFQLQHPQQLSKLRLLNPAAAADRSLF